MILGISPLGPNIALDDTFKSFVFNLGGLRGLIPSGLGGATFNHHTSALLLTDVGYILLEYGSYNKNSDAEGDLYYYYYSDEGGVRFIHMSYYDFWMRVTKNNKYSSAGRIIELYVNNEMTLDNLISKISYKMNIKFKDYNAGNNNCQDFMKYVIYFLNAKRDRNDREIHMKAKLHIPLVVLEQIEENEKFR